jgi:hypothetical protein
VLVLLLALRLPSLAQPAGADQSLYAYVGERLLAGELPYRDAWDQKPPGIHFTYAAMLAVWPSHAVVAATDLVAAALTACLLGLSASRLAGGVAAGYFTAALYLLLANPAYTRLGGVRIRAQCETFIGLLMAAAVALLATRLARDGTLGRRDALLSALCVGMAIVFKYNAAVYAVPLAVALVVAHWNRHPSRRHDLVVLSRLATVSCWAKARIVRLAAATRPHTPKSSHCVPRH